MDDGPPAADSAYVAPAEREERRVLDLSLDLANSSEPPRECAVPAGDEIVVCAAPAEDQEQFRLHPLDPRFADSADEADNRIKMDLGDGVELAPDTEQGTVGGWPSNRVMVRAKIKF